eukprot:UN22981
MIIMATDYGGVQLVAQIDCSHDLTESDLFQKGLDASSRELGMFGGGKNKPHTFLHAPATGNCCPCCSKTNNQNESGESTELVTVADNKQAGSHSVDDKGSGNDENTVSVKLNDEPAELEELRDTFRKNESRERTFADLWQSMQAMPIIKKRGTVQNDEDQDHKLFKYEFRGEREVTFYKHLKENIEESFDTDVHLTDATVMVHEDLSALCCDSETTSECLDSFCNCLLGPGLK